MKNGNKKALILNTDFFSFNNPCTHFFSLNRHSQTTLVPDCPVGTTRLWDGFSLSFIMGNGRAVGQDLGIVLQISLFLIRVWSLHIFSSKYYTINYSYFVIQAEHVRFMDAVYNGVTHTDLTLQWTKGHLFLKLWDFLSDFHKAMEVKGHIRQQ